MGFLLLVSDSYKIRSTDAERSLLRVYTIAFTDCKPFSVSSMVCANSSSAFRIVVCIGGSFIGSALSLPSDNCASSSAMISAPRAAIFSCKAPMEVLIST